MIEPGQRTAITTPPPLPDTAPSSAAGKRAHRKLLAAGLVGSSIGPAQLRHRRTRHESQCAAGHLADLLRPAHRGDPVGRSPVGPNRQAGGFAVPDGHGLITVFSAWKLRETDTPAVRNDPEAVPGTQLY